MRKYGNLLIVIALMSSLAIVITKLFSSNPIQIISETGETITSSNSSYFTLSTTILLMILSFIIGTSIIYLYYKVSAQELTALFYERNNSEKIKTDKFKLALNMLKGEDKEVFSAIITSKHGIKQNELGTRMSLTKVKITRILSRLESKKLITKSRQGLTNLISIKEN